MQRIHFTALEKLSGEALAALHDQYRQDPRTLLEVTEEEAPRIVQALTSFYQTQLKGSGLAGYVIGLSGGIDSTVVAHLLVAAVGPERVHGVIMPTEFNPKADIDDALATAEHLHITHNDPRIFQKQINDIIESLQALGEVPLDGELQRMKRGNILARVRMIVLRDIARARGYMVAGTSNASERMLGYSTLAGDGLGGVDNEGLDQLFKTAERSLARFLGVPASILDKPPSARLWHGQTDEGELDITYEHVDQVLVGHMLGLPAAEIAQAVNRPEVTVDKVEEVFRRVRQNRYKSSLPCGARLY